MFQNLQVGEREKSLIQFLPRDARKRERDCKTDPEQYLTDLALHLQYPELIHYHKGVIKLSPPSPQDMSFSRAAPCMANQLSRYCGVGLGK